MSFTSSQWLVVVATAFMLAPWALAKLMLLTVLLAAIAARADAGIVLSAAKTERGLMALGLLALVISPYWAIAPSPFWRILGWCLNITIVVVWSKHASGVIRLRPVEPSATPWMVATLMLAATGRNLFGPIEFRGDEDVHITRPLRALEALTSSDVSWVAIALALAAIGLVLVIRNRSVGPLIPPWLWWGLPIAAAAFFLARPLEQEMLLRVARYPALGAWLQSSLAVSPLAALPGFETAPYQESLYRLSSYGSALALALLAARVIKGTPAFRTLGALLVGTTPTIMYFSGTGYTDTSGAVIATFGLMGLSVWARRGLKKGAEGSIGAPIMGVALLVKESLAPMALMAALGTSLARFASARPRDATAWFKDSLRLSLLVLAPAATYIGWRLLAERLLRSGQSMRGFGLDTSALVNTAWARIVGHAWVEQYGPVIALAALALLLSRRRSLLAVLFLVPALGQVFFLNVEFVSDLAWGRLPLYAGFARYQLTLLPALVCLAVVGLRLAWKKSPRFAWLLVLVGLGWNLAARPVSFDRIQDAFWGDYVTETSGERYPYDALYEWLAQNRETRDITIVGRDYSFRDAFYLKKNKLRQVVISVPSLVPRSPLVLAGGPDRSTLISAHVAHLRAAADTRGPVVLHLSSWISPEALPRRVGPLARIRDFCLGERCLMVYESVS